MRLLLLSLFAALSTIAAQDPVPLDEFGKEAEVVIETVTAAGDELTNVSVVILQDGKVVRKLQNDRRLKLPYGSYRFEARATGALPISRVVTVQAPVVLVPLCFFVAPIELPEPPTLVRGRTSDLSRTNDCRWVRLLSPFADNVVHDARASSEGFFAFQNVRSGKYIALTIGRSGICDQAEVSVSYGPTYTLDLQVRWRAGDVTP